MKIEDAGELRTFEPVPAETVMYLSVVRFDAGTWAAGPYSESKADVVRALTTIWKHAKDARIYTVRLPISLHQAEVGE